MPIADILDQLVTAKQRFVVCGDFNCPGSGDRQLDANLDDLLHSYDLMQHVQDTTPVGLRQYVVNQSIRRGLE